MIDVALFDYGAGNHHSLKKGLERGGARVAIIDDWNEALARDALVLPGVGSFGAAVRGLRGEGERVRKALEDGLAALGICLGMQLLLPASEEAGGAGIGLIGGRVRRLRARIVPQMGWNDVEWTPENGTSDPVTKGIGPITAYFANSFVCEVEEEELVLAETEYEGDRFPTGVRKGRCWGFQFHPEKSSGPGLELLANWVEEAAR